MSRLNLGTYAHHFFVALPTEERIMPRQRSMDSEQAAFSCRPTGVSDETPGWRLEALPQVPRKAPAIWEAAGYAPTGMVGIANRVAYLAPANSPLAARQPAGQLPFSLS